MRIFRWKFSENFKFCMRAIMPFVQEEFDKIQQALSRSYAERDKYAGEMDKLREELERVQVKPKKDNFFCFFLHFTPLRVLPASTRLLKRRPSWSWTRPTRRSTSCARRWSGTPERVEGWVSTSEDARLVYDSRFERWSEMIMDDHQWSYDGSIKEALFLVPPTFGFLSPSLLNLVFIW